MMCLAQGHNTASRVRINSRPCHQESDTLPAELSVLSHRSPVSYIIPGDGVRKWGGLLVCCVPMFEQKKRDEKAISSWAVRSAVI